MVKYDNLGARHVQKSALIVAFEGMPGTGKTTCSHSLALSLENKNFRTGLCNGETTGDAPVFRSIARRYPFNHPKRIITFWALRFDQDEVIGDLIKKVDVLLIDRYIGTELVYGRFAHKIPSAITDWVISKLRFQPDITFFFSAPLEILAQRKQSKTYKNWDTAKRINAGYAATAKNLGWAMIDATENEKVVHDQCLGVILKKLGAKRP